MPDLYSEANYENSVIELFRNMGYQYVYGPDVERDYKSPLYDDILEESLVRLNPKLPDAAIQDALYKLKNFENDTLVQKNIVFMNYLQNGIEVSYHHKGEVRSDIVYIADYRNTEETYQRTMELLDLSDPPTCILYPDDFAGFGGINAIRERGLRIPEDISVAAYDGIRIGRHIEPKLTTIRQDTEQIGKLAAENLIKLIEHPRSTIIRPIVVEGELYEGSTVKDINKVAE